MLMCPDLHSYSIILPLLLQLFSVAIFNPSHIIWKGYNLPLTNRHQVFIGSKPSFHSSPQEVRDNTDKGNHSAHSHSKEEKQPVNLAKTLKKARISLLSANG